MEKNERSDVVADPNSIVIDGNATGGPRNNNEYATNAGNTTKVQPTSPQNQATSYRSGFGNYPAQDDILRPDGENKEYETIKADEANSQDGKDNNGSEGSSRRLAVRENEFTAEQKAKLDNIINIFKNNDDAKHRFKKDNNKYK